MGAASSTNTEHKIAELLFERGTDSLAVEVHSAAVEDEAVTFFTYATDSKHRNIASNTIQAHKVLRHPSILKLVTFSQSGESSHVVTEAATPLCACVDYVNSWEITVGLTKILEALHFLHTQAGYSHNNISMESIFVTPDGDWKLGRLDCASRLSLNNVEHIQSISLLCDPDIYPPQPADKQVAPTAHCRDINGFGHVCEALLDKLDTFRDQLVSIFGDVIDLMTSADSAEVPAAAEILAQPLLSNQLVLTLKFIEEITLKLPEEKKEFFSSLTDKLRQLPETVIAKLLVRPLLRRFVVEDEVAYSTVLPSLLTPKSHANHHGLLSPSLYKKYLPPIIYRLFTVKEYHVRKLLLDNFHSYCHLLDKTRLEKFIMPLILQGLHDSKDVIVEQTLVALSHMVPVLGGHIVIGTERRDTFIGGGVTKASPSKISSDIVISDIGNEQKVNGISTPGIAVKKERTKRPPRKPRQRNNSQTKVKFGAKKLSVDGSDKASSPTDTTGLGDLPGASPNQVDSEEQHSQVNSEQGLSDWDDLDPPSPSQVDIMSSAATEQHSIDYSVEHSPRAHITELRHTDPVPLHTDSSNQSRKSGTMSLKSKSVVKKKPTKIKDDFSKLDIKTKVKPVSYEMDYFADMAPDIKGRSKNDMKSEGNGTTKNDVDVKNQAVNLAYALSTDQSTETKDGWGDDEDGWDW